MPRFNFSFNPEDRTEETFRRPTFNFGNAFQMGTNQPDLSAISQRQEEEARVDPTERYRTAFDKMQNLQDEMPIYGDPKYERGKWGKLGAILAGAGAGYFSKNPEFGMQVGSNILERPFEQAYSQWQQRFKTAKDTAVEERARLKEFNDQQEQGSRIRKNNLESDALEETAGLNRVSKIADIKAKLASTGLDEVQAEKIANDLLNPNLEFRADNRGGVTAYNPKTGGVVKHYNDVGIGDDALAKLRGSIESSHIAQRGDQDRLTLDSRFGGLKQLQDLKFGQDERMENIRFGHQKDLEGLKQTGRVGLVQERAKVRGQYQNDLSNPAFQRELNLAMADYSKDPKNKALFAEHFSVDPKGNYFLTDPDDAEGLDLFNQIKREMANKGKR